MSNQLIGIKKQRGAGLVELMLSIALGLVLVLGVSEIFLGSKQSYTMHAGVSRLQEGARLAMEIIAPEIRMAGYTGCFSRSIPIKNTLNDTDFEFSIGAPLEAYEAVTNNSWASNSAGNLDALPDDVDEDNVAGGTDILVIRRVDDNGIRIDKAMPFPSADIKVTAGGDPIPLSDGDIVLISDCRKAALFQITNFTQQGGNNSGNVVHNAGGGPTPGNFTKLLTDDGSIFDTDASLYRLQTVIYFIAESSHLNDKNNASLSLWRKVGASSPEELVTGIENMQLLYGEDISGDGTPNRYVAANNINDMGAVVTVRIELSANSIDAVGQQSDGIIRKVFSETIQLRNRSVLAGL